jgi:hypothetical protein
MKLQRFNIHTDLEHINAWLTAHKMPPVTRHSLPELGYMAWHNGMAIGAIFLRRCEGEAGIVDSLISNPDAQPQLRHIALDALINHIVDQARKVGVKMLLGYTVDASTLERSTRLGFKQSPYQVVVMDLSKSGE